MNVRILGLALSFGAAALFSSNVVLAESSMTKSSAAANVAAADTPKSDSTAKHKDLEKHEKGLHEKKEGREVGETKESK